MNNMKRALYPGRFQPFHLGHLEAIKHIISEYSELIIMVGSALQSHSLLNPFTASERIFMIKVALDEEEINPASYFIIPVADLQIHSIWVSYVCSLVPRFEVVYSNDPLTRRLFIESNFKVKKIPFFKRNLYSATEIRKRIINNNRWKELLPKSVSKYIMYINGSERLRNLVKKDDTCIDN